MSPVTVLVTLYSRGGATEALAHAAAVGAVQQRALIRLRRVPEPDPQATLATFAAARESLTRMYKEYVAPTEADVLAAGALIIASPGDVDAAAPVWRPYLGLLERLHAEGKLTGKVAAVLPTGPASVSLDAALTRLGLTVVPAVGEGIDGAVALGRAAATAAQSRVRF